MPRCSQFSILYFRRESRSNAVGKRFFSRSLSLPSSRAMNFHCSFSGKNIFSLVERISVIASGRHEPKRLRFSGSVSSSR